MNRVLVCGGRDYQDKKHVYNVLDKLKPGLVIQGGATGADALASEWADENGVPCMTFKPAWTRYKSLAGPIRNQWMISYGKPSLVVAFPGGKGTKNMCELADKHGVELQKEY